MTETPVILSHNVLKDAVITGDCRDGFPPYRVADGLKWTWWEGVSSAPQYIYVKAANMLQNGDFELNVNSWALVPMGSAEGTFSRNTVDPLSGVADGYIDADVADDGENSLRVATLNTYRLKANRTYRFSFAAKVTFFAVMRFGFLRADLSAEEFFTDSTINTWANEYYLDFTPSADGEYRVFWRPLEPGDFKVDDAHLCEVRDVDTVVIDRGHTLQAYMFTVQKAESAFSNPWWLNWHVGLVIVSNGPYYYQPPSSTRGVQWKIAIQPFSLLPGLPPPQITLMWIGKQWTLPRNFSGLVDPDARKITSHVITGERGIEARTQQSSLRVFNGVLRNITPAEYMGVELFMEDTDQGTLPFAFLWRPASAPEDLLVMRLDKEERLVPYRGGYLRDWQFNAVELAGERKL